MPTTTRMASWPSASSGVVEYTWHGLPFMHMLAGWPVANSMVNSNRNVNDTIVTNSVCGKRKCSAGSTQQKKMGAPMSMRF